MEKQYEIRIAGSGTRQDIANALRLIEQAIDNQPSNDKQQVIGDIDGAEWGDCTLLTEIRIIE